MAEKSMIRNLQSVLFLAALLCHVPVHAESTTNKCTDGKKITYANMPCEKLGLKTVGPVKRMFTVIPALNETDKKQTKDSGKAKKDAPEKKDSKNPKPGPDKSLQDE